MVYSIQGSEIFDAWLTTLKDVKAKATVVRRIQQAALGNFGDHKRLSEFLYEMRIHISPGWRIYYTIENNTVVFLLSGGSKKDQSRDIAQAELAIKERQNNGIHTI